MWEAALAVDEREVYLTFQVHNEAIVIPETVDCIRALTGLESDAGRSMGLPDASLGLRRRFLPASAAEKIAAPAGGRS